MAIGTTLLGTGLGLLGERRRSRDARAAADAARLDSVFGVGPGGNQVGFDVNTGQLTQQFGAENQALFDALGGIAGQALGQDFSGALSQIGGIFDARQNLAGQVADPNTAILDQFQGASGALGLGQLGQIGQLLGTGFGRGVQDDALAGTQSLLADAFAGGDAAAASRLNLLREQAAPFEGRAFNQLNQNLFATGRSGTSGGALQTEAFARGLGQADLSRQLAAQEEGRRFTNDALNRATGGFNLASQARGIEDSLLSSAFNRFGQTGQLAADLNRQSFTQNQTVLDTLFNRSGQVLNDAIGLAGLPNQLQAGSLGVASGALQGRAGLENTLRSLFGQTLDAGRAESGANFNAASALISGDAFGGNALSALGGSLVNNSEGIGNVLSRIFGG